MAVPLFLFYSIGALVILLTIFEFIGKIRNEQKVYLHLLLFLSWTLILGVFLIGIDDPRTSAIFSAPWMAYVVLIPALWELLHMIGATTGLLFNAEFEDD